MESTYKKCLYHELTQKGLKVEMEKPVPLVYKGLPIDEGYRLDLLVEGRIVIELKTVSEITRVHKAQTLT